MQREMSTQTMDSNSPLSTHNLRKAIECVRLNRFVKVLPWNCVPQFKSSYFPIAYIINEDDSYSAGTHWSVIYYPFENSIVEFFDSFGRKPKQEFIKDQNFIHNNLQLQTLFSSTCGHYCLLFVWFRIKLGYTMKEFVDFFREKSQEEVVQHSREIFFL